MKKRHNWVFNILLLLLLLLLVVFFPTLTKAQCLIDRCTGTKYQESDQIYKLNLELTHNRIEGLLDNIAPKLSGIPVTEAILVKNPQDKMGGFKVISKESRDYRNKSIPKYEVAGLCFFPIWNDLGESKTNDNTKVFQTNGIRIAIALWQKDSICNINNPDLLYLAGFEKVEKLVPPNTPARDLLNRFAISIPVDTRNSEIYPVEDLNHKVREFDFVFLEYNRYKELATSTNFYPKNDRKKEGSELNPHEGIIIKRSLVGYDIEDSSSSSSIESLGECYSEHPSNGSKQLFYRTLYFSPDPIPDFGTRPARPAIAFEDAKRCPPYWINDSPNRCNLHANLSDVVCRVMQYRRTVEEIKIKIIPIPIPIPQCIGINYGRSQPFENTDSLITRGGEFFELSLEQKIWHRYITIETLVGRYQFDFNNSLVKIWGVNLMLKGSIPIFKFLNSNNLARSFIYLEGGAGTYFDLPNTPNFGIIGGAGLRIPIAFNDKHFFDLEAGVQYQDLTRINNSNNPMQLVSGKIGIKRCLW